MNLDLVLLAEIISFSTLLYYFLHKKTRISLKYLYIDNVAVIIVSLVLISIAMPSIQLNFPWLPYLIAPFLILIIAFTLTMVRFWRTPNRKVVTKKNEIVSPADGNIIYISRIELGQTPISVKGSRHSRLDELTKTELLNRPCWLIGINMTPFDVHKNCAPMDGKIILNQHFKGKFLSLKKMQALAENERNTYVIENKDTRVGVVQIASRLVRRIDSYVKSGSYVRKGEWLGMIRFGSQVDVIIPADFEVQIQLKDQVYAGTTVIATTPRPIS